MEKKPVSTYITIALTLFLLFACPPLLALPLALTHAAADHPSQFYFAEGYTGTNFAEFLCVCNSNPTETIAHVVYYVSGPRGDAVLPDDYYIPPRSRITVDVRGVVGPGNDVSILVTSEDADVVAERPMYFNYAGVWTGGSCTVGANQPSTDVYFAEGYTGPGFDTYICVLNPNTDTAELTFRFQTQEAGEVLRRGQVGPNSRATFLVNTLLGPDYQASLHLESTQPMVAERPMYFSYLGTGSYNWPGGHCVMGLSAVARDYYFAEGTTREGFEEWLCIQNPNPVGITVHATYQFGPGQGDPLETDYTVPAGSRYTVLVEEEVGADKDVSSRLTCDSYDFVAERPMYFLYNGWCTGGSCVMGTASTGNRWIFAEGCTALMFDEWLCIFNPGPDAADVTLEYFTDDGQAIERRMTVDASRRITVDVNENAGPDLNLSAVVSTTGQGVLVERPMYFLYDWQWPGGSCVVGYEPLGGTD